MKIGSTFNTNLGSVFDSKCFHSVFSLETGCIVGRALAEPYFGTSHLVYSPVSFRAYY